MRCRRQIPVDLQSLATLHGGPGIRRHHSNTAERAEARRLAGALNLEYLLNTGYLEGVGVVEIANSSPVNRRTGDHCIEQVLEGNICAIHRLTGNNIFTVDGFRVCGLQLAVNEPGFLADKSQLVVTLKYQCIAPGNVELPRLGCEIPKPEFLAGRLVNDGVYASLHLTNRHAPLIGGRLLQHLPGRRCGSAHGLVPVAHAAGTVGVLVAVFAVIAFSLFDSHLVPVCTQLVGTNHHQAGPDALTHFGAVVHNGNQAISVDMDEHVRVVHPSAGHGSGTELSLFIASQGHIPTGCKHQGRATRQAHQEAPAADVGDHQVVIGAHASPSLPEARSIAARIRL